MRSQISCFYISFCPTFNKILFSSLQDPADAVISGQLMKPQEVLKDPELKKQSGDQRQPAELLSSLIVRAGGSYSVHLNDAHHKLMWSLAGVVLTPNRLP